MRHRPGSIGMLAAAAALGVSTVLTLRSPPPEVKPEPEPEPDREPSPLLLRQERRQLTPQDHARIAAAKAKRQRKAQKRLTTARTPGALAQPRQEGE